METTLTIPLSVIVARESIDNPWQDHAWRPVEVFIGQPAGEPWRELGRSETAVLYHAGTQQVELHRKETAAYQLNLEDGDPAVYVVLRQNEDGDDDRVDVAAVTVSPFEAEAYGLEGSDIIARVPMPELLAELLREFIDAHHVDQPFIKRMRDKVKAHEEYKFGQEPLVELRERMRLATRERDRNG
ncbi:MAG: DUF3305 domain-containing protein [Hyphomicrobiaceae bacterium]